MLTPQMIEQMNKATGLNVPTNSVSPSGSINPPVKSRADEIEEIAQKALADRAAKEKANTLQGRLQSAGGYGNEVGAEQVAGVEKVKSSIETGAKNIQEGFDTSKPLLERVGKTALGAAEAGFGTISGAAQTLFAPITPAISKAVEWITPKLREANPDLAKVYDSIAPKVDEIAQKNPELATLAGDILNTALLVVGGKGAKVVGEAPVKEALSKEALGTAGKELTDVVKTGAEKIISAPQAIKSKITNIFTSKTPEEILATPEDKLYKLSKAERQYYFDNQTQTITKKSAELEAKVKANLDAQTTKAQSDAEALQRQLEVSSRDEVIKLRPKIVKAMGEQSKTYRSLVDEAMAGKENISINKGELVQHIETQYADNPQMAQAIKDKLGVGTLSNEGKPTIHLDQETTLGELFNKTKSLKQEVSSGAKTGTKVFTAEDKLTDDAIHTLTDFMKTKGVDFKDANQFWAKYAPIRNQLVAEAKPFLQTETQTGRFARTLQRVAQGKDVNNENFIKEVENLLGEPVGKDLKATIQKMSDVEKQNVANQIEADAQKAKIKLDKELALKNLSKTKLATEQKKLWDRLFKGVVYTAITGGAGALGVKAVKAFTGQ